MSLNYVGLNSVLTVDQSKALSSMIFLSGTNIQTK